MYSYKIHARAHTRTDVYFMVNNLFPHKERIEHSSFTKFVEEEKTTDNKFGFGNDDLGVNTVIVTIARF